MGRATGIVGALALLFTLAGPARAASLSEQVTQSLEKMSRGSCDLPAWRSIIGDRGFRSLESKLRSAAYVSLAVCGEDDEVALLRKATAEAGSSSFAWSVRFISSASHGDQQDALAALEGAAERADDGTFNIYSDEVVTGFSTKIQKNPAATRRFLMALDRADWQPVSAFKAPDWMWLDLVTILASEGDLENAKRVALRIRLPHVLQRMRLDKRYDQLVAANPDHYDVVFAALAQLEADNKALAADPENGLGIDMVAHSLRALGRPKEALAIADAALARSDPLENAGVDYRNWVMNARANALNNLGDFDGAVEALKAAAALKERSGDNVSQVINLAGLLVAVGRAEESLALLQPFDAGRKASPYGDMWVATTRTCAFYALGRTAEAAKARAFVTEHAADNSAAVIHAALCVNDLEAAAAAIISQLEDKDTRADTLFRLSRYNEWNGTPYIAEFDRRVEVLRNRPDIRAAVAKVGRLETVALYGGPLGAGF